MSSAGFDAVVALFDAACEQPAPLRDAFVAAAAVDPAVRARVRRMLAGDDAHDPLADAFDAALRTIATRPPPPARIGAYTLLHEIGCGGMGTVFLAERRLGEARQRVALKLVRGFPTREARLRLERERALLAGLEHPNIARLIDGGESDEGQPYLVIEYVDGEPLLDACARRQWPLDARLALFGRLCHAVQHAHQRLVVHRDIKPSNVLVRSDGEPVLLDFGIGKLLDDGEGAATQVFTPAYASPEQRRGEAATTASDVYGLGTVLYELAGARVGDAGRDPASLRGDLARIVGCALHEDPARRYATADALAADVARLRSGLPVAAAPDRLPYRVRKHLARHPWGVAAGIVALLVAGMFAWRLAVERDRALHQAERAEAARDLLLSVFDAAAPERTAGNAFSARDLIEFGRRRYAGGLAGRADLQLPLAATLARVYLSLGEPRAALELLEPVRGLARGDDRDAVLARADIEELLGRAYREVDRVAEGDAALGDALALRERFAASDPLALAGSLHHAGQAALEGGRASAAEALLQRALQLRERAVPPDPLALAQTRRVLALAHLELGDVARARDEAAALEAGLDALLPPNHPGRIDVLATHATILARQGRFDEARSRLDRALAVAHASVGERSTITADLENRLADSLLGLGRFREALAHNEAAWRIQRTVRDDPVAGAIAQADLGTACATIGDYARAQALLGEAVAALAAARPDDDPERLRARSNFARAQSLAGRHAEALATLDDVLERTRRTRGERSERYAFELLRLSSALLRAGRLDAAQARIDQAEPLCRALLPADHPWRGDVSNQRGRLALERGDAALAEREFAAALAALAPQAGLAYDMRLIAAVGHIEALARLGRDGEARAEAAAIRADVERELLPGAIERQRLDTATAALQRRAASPRRAVGAGLRYITAPAARAGAPACERPRMQSADFIEVIDGALDAKTCADLVAAFEASDKLVRGKTSGGVNTRLKDSWDLHVSGHPEWKNVENLLNGVMLNGLIAYLRKYTHLALAPTALYRQSPGDSELRMIGVDDVRAMPEAEVKQLIVRLFRPGGINLQRYFADEGGYPYWHSEISPKVETDDNLHRVLLWTIYLNDDFDEGETEFLFQQRKVVPKTGSLLIAPAGFTHTHRGNMPRRGHKYIATSWVLFQRAAQLYATPGAPG